MLGLPLTFTVPLVLTALAALPAIWLLLKITPPQPARVDFPPLRILADLLPERETPARTPWWLLLIRLALAAFLILAAAGPIWNPGATESRDGPVLLLVDNGFPAAHDWRERLAIAVERDAIGRFLNAAPDAEILWISDGVGGVDAQSFVDGLTRMAAERPVTVLKSERAPALALAGAENAAGQFTVRVLRAEPNGRDTGIVRALDLKNLPLADARFAFEAGATETAARFELPMEVRNSIARIEILGEGSAGALTPLHERGQRRRGGLVFGGTADQAQPLLAPTYYISRALSPFAEIREGRGG